MAQVLESLMILYNEGAGVGEELRKYAITEIRGDWKWQQDSQMIWSYVFFSWGYDSCIYIYILIVGCS